MHVCMFGCMCIWKRERERWALKITWGHPVHPPSQHINLYCNNSDNSFATSKLSIVRKNKFKRSLFNFWTVLIIKKQLSVITGISFLQCSRTSYLYTLRVHGYILMWQFLKYWKIMFIYPCTLHINFFILNSPILLKCISMSQCHQFLFSWIPFLELSYLVFLSIFRHIFFF